MAGGPSAAALTPRVAEGPTWMPDADKQDEPCASVKEGRPGERRGRTLAGAVGATPAKAQGQGADSRTPVSSLSHPVGKCRGKGGPERPAGQPGVRSRIRHHHQEPTGLAMEVEGQETRG